MKKNELNLLILEDCLKDAELMINQIEQEGFNIKWKRVEAEDTFRKALSESPDLILADYNLPSYNGLEAIRLQQKVAPEIPLIMVSGSTGEDIAVECMRSGAVDYVLKDRISRLGPVVKRVLKEVEGNRYHKRVDAQRLAALEALHNSEEQYRSLVESSQDPIYLIDRNLNYLNVNEKLLSRYGKTKGEVIGQNYKQFHSIKRVKEFSARIEKVFESGNSLSYEHKSHRDGKYFLRTLSPIINNETGKTAAITVISKDITDLKQAKKREEEHYRDIELLSEAAMRFVEFPSEKDIYNFIGEQLQEFTGKDSYIIINSIDEGKDILTIRTILGLGKFTENITKLIGKHPVGLTYKVKDESLNYLCDGKLHKYNEGLYDLALKSIPEIVCKSIENLLNVENTYTIGFTKEGHLFGNVIISTKKGAVGIKDHGIIETFIKQASIAVQRRQAEEAKQALEAQLLQSQKLESIGTLASGVAHEINNPLMGMINYAELINSRTKDDTLKEFSAGIIEEGDRVAKIVRNLLSFARQDKESHSPAQIKDIIDASLSLIGSVLRKDQITLTVDISEGLPSVKCRSQQIQQVIINLLTNARDALNERYPDYDENKIVKISAKPYEKDRVEWIRTTVEDHGAGIPDDVAERIFEPFFTTKPRDVGTGLGLSVSYGLIKDHHGELSVEIEPGKFTRFHIDLPVNNGWNVGD
jgi:PAS domain S-box-containing protein